MARFQKRHHATTLTLCSGAVFAYMNRVTLLFLIYLQSMSLYLNAFYNSYAGSAYLDSYSCAIYIELTLNKLSF